MSSLADAILEDMLLSVAQRREAKYQCWENDIQALLLDLDKIDGSF